MTEQYKNIINLAYEAFNARDIDTVLSFMHQNVHWPNGWEGGYVEGHNGVREVLDKAMEGNRPKCEARFL